MKAKALIIGGGPTTLELDRWTDTERHVTVLTSTAYLNPYLQTIQADYFIISTQTDFTSQEFAKWYSNNPNCRFVIETNHLWKQPKGMDKFVFKMEPLEISVEPDFTVGIVGRVLMWLIQTDQFGSISVVGFDGYSKEGKGQHAFRKEMKQLPSDAAVNTYEKFRSNFERYVTHIDKLVQGKDVELINLGKGHDSNILSHMNTQTFK